MSELTRSREESDTSPMKASVMVQSVRKEAFILVRMGNSRRRHRYFWRYFPFETVSVRCDAGHVSERPTVRHLVEDIRDGLCDYSRHRPSPTPPKPKTTADSTKSTTKSESAKIEISSKSKSMLSSRETGSPLQVSLTPIRFDEMHMDKVHALCNVHNALVEARLKKGGSVDSVDLTGFKLLPFASDLNCDLRLANALLITVRNSASSAPQMHVHESRPDSAAGYSLRSASHKLVLLCADDCIATREERDSLLYDVFRGAFLIGQQKAVLSNDSLPPADSLDLATYTAFRQSTRKGSQPSADKLKKGKYRLVSEGGIDTVKTATTAFAPTSATPLPFFKFARQSLTQVNTEETPVEAATAMTNVSNIQLMQHLAKMRKTVKIPTKLTVNGTDIVINPTAIPKATAKPKSQSDDAVAISTATVTVTLTQEDTKKQAIETADANGDNESAEVSGGEKAKTGIKKTKKTEETVEIRAKSTVGIKEEKTTTEYQQMLRDATMEKASKSVWRAIDCDMVHREGEAYFVPAVLLRMGLDNWFGVVARISKTVDCALTVDGAGATALMAKATAAVDEEADSGSSSVDESTEELHIDDIDLCSESGDCHCDSNSNSNSEAETEIVQVLCDEDMVEMKDEDTKVESTSSIGIGTVKSEEKESGSSAKASTETLSTDVSSAVSSSTVASLKSKSGTTTEMATTTTTSTAAAAKSSSMETTTANWKNAVTPLMYALMNKRIVARESLLITLIPRDTKYTSKLEYLLRCDGNLHSALHIALSYDMNYSGGKPQRVCALKRAVADAFIWGRMALMRDANGYTPLHMALTFEKQSPKLTLLEALLADESLLNDSAFWSQLKTYRGENIVYTAAQTDDCHSDGEPMRVGILRFLFSDRVFDSLLKDKRVQSKDFFSLRSVF